VEKKNMQQKEEAAAEGRSGGGVGKKGEKGRVRGRES